MCRSFRANHGKAKATPATAGGDYHVYLALDNSRHEAGKQIDPGSAPAPSSMKFCPSVLARQAATGRTATVNERAARGQEQSFALTA